MKIRCAIYTRKSSDEGLDQSFNSLDAQHEACAAYIASQRHEGWRAVSNRYDDGGLSGGTLDRPGLQRLLEDIDRGQIDMVVVYKIDRLTRSLTDFAKLVERLDAADCSFVSVTQSFNTSTSMGRLTLNVLLSFAQFEREVTAERIKDKIAASKKKGLWMGGLPPLGYDPHPDKTRRALVVNDIEAETVRRLFALYLEAGCLIKTAKAAIDEGLTSKRRTFASGRSQGGGPLSRGQIHATLTNPVYRGLIRHRDKTWPGTHPAIIDEALWDAVQQRLQNASARRRGAETLDTSSAPLLGKFTDDTGDRITPTHTTRHGRRFRYYVSNGLVSGKPRPDAWRLPAPAFEKAVAGAVSQHLRTLADRRTMAIGTAADIEVTSRSLLGLAEQIAKDGATKAQLIDQGHLLAGHLALHLDPVALEANLAIAPEALEPHLLRLTVPFATRQRGVETKIVAGDAEAAPDPALLKALCNAHHWAHDLKSGASIKAIAETHGCSEGYVRRLLPLTTLSPKLQHAISTGTQPVDLTLQRLVTSQLPLDWSDQEKSLLP